MDSLWLCIAITLGMALVIGLVQPFARPQMNVLQSVCFACALAVVVIGSWTPDSILTVEGVEVTSHSLDMQTAQA